ncbi:type II secretion system minor pseudopilin GspK [Alcaligenes sp.]|uniref:type II secretion system minor pseudopilin GspK n=1 Tax=Alcaligenes sp. TaxID=512 RepID=UPI003B731134|nr:type II secretion system minor pseudopilin GspK [Klebsiella pneumoniae]
MAVIAVLVVVAIVAVLAAALMARQATAIRAAQAGQTQTQARWLLQGEVSRAQTALYADAQRDAATRLDGLWARPVAGAVIGELGGERALVFSEIIDEQSKFNLRNLVEAGQVDPGESAAFLRLCDLVGVPRDQANRIARRVIVSLVEADRHSGLSLAEAEIKVARAAAQNLGIDMLSSREQAPRLRDLDDLLGEPGLNPNIVALLRPYVTVLPQRTWINANTAGPEVLAAWVPGLSFDRAKAMLAARNSGQWFINRGDFANRLQMPEIDETEILIGITSQWFRLSGALRTPRTTLAVQALLHDDKKSLPQVVWLREGV